MIEFKYTDDVSTLAVADDTSALVVIKTTAVGIEAVLEAFKTFLMFSGYHEDNVNSIVYEGTERQGLPSRNDSQLELLPDEHETGGI